MFKQIDWVGLEVLCQQFVELFYVQQVQFDLVWVECLSVIFKFGECFVFGLIILLVLIFLLVVGNIICLYIENCCNEIEVIKLVGGMDGYVCWLFLYMGVLYGLGVGILFWVLLVYLLNWLNGLVVNFLGLYGSDFGLQGVLLDDGLLLIVGVVLFGWVGVWLVVVCYLCELVLC